MQHSKNGGLRLFQNRFTCLSNRIPGFQPVLIKGNIIKTIIQSVKLMILMLYLLFILYPEEYYVNQQTFWGEKFSKERL